ncbi:S1 RNA-binding domain-containing protein, partial [Patescibacteria group bacterium]|nr:S1 RNA-binding domain-containing protein [Patescibacteria group bacterium]
AAETVKNIVREFQPGEKMVGKVVRIEPFGAFVQLAPGRDGLVHVSRMSTEYVEDPSQFVKLDEMVEVRVVEVDDNNRISLSMLAEGQERPRSDERRPSGGGRPGGFQKKRFDRRGSGQRSDRRR